MSTVADHRHDFDEYFNCADELWAPEHRSSHGADVDGWCARCGAIVSTDALAARHVKAARRAADALGLPWPPYLPAAEVYALDHPEVRS